GSRGRLRSLDRGERLGRPVGKVRPDGDRADAGAERLQRRAPRKGDRLCSVRMGCGHGRHLRPGGGELQEGTPPATHADCACAEEAMKMTRRKALAAAGAGIAGALTGARRTAAAPADRVVKSGRLKQSVSRWPYQKI